MLHFMEAGLSERCNVTKLMLTLKPKGYIEKHHLCAHRSFCIYRRSTLFSTEAHAVLLIHGKFLDRINLFFKKGKKKLMQVQKAGEWMNWICNWIWKSWLQCQHKTEAASSPGSSMALWLASALFWEQAYRMLIRWVQLKLTKKRSITDLAKFFDNIKKNKNKIQYIF